MALVLLAPLYWWMVCVVPPFGVVEFATHVIETGEHCYSFCEQLSDPVPPPHIVGVTVVSEVEGLPLLRFVNGHLPPQAARGRPPLWHSLSHGLRAPPPEQPLRN